jgi:hypothetical protein
MLGLMVAVETALKRDHQADWREWEKRVKLIANALRLHISESPSNARRARFATIPSRMDYGPPDGCPQLNVSAAAFRQAVLPDVDVVARHHAVAGGDVRC